jgi:hypothetical protein
MFHLKIRDIEKKMSSKVVGFNEIHISRYAQIIYAINLTYSFSVRESNLLPQPLESN